MLSGCRRRGKSCGDPPSSPLFRARVLVRLHRPTTRTRLKPVRPAMARATASLVMARATAILVMARATAILVMVMVTAMVMATSFILELPASPTTRRRRAMPSESSYAKAPVGATNAVDHNEPAHPGERERASSADAKWTPMPSRWLSAWWNHRPPMLTGIKAPPRGPRTPSSTMNQPIRASASERARRTRSGRAWLSAKLVAGVY
jgi:hypothetical protein